MQEPQSPDYIPVKNRNQVGIPKKRIAEVRSDYDSLRPKVNESLKAEGLDQAPPKQRRSIRRAILRTAVDERRLGEFQTEIAQTLARVDPLTRLPNRRWFAEETQRKISQLERTKAQKPLWFLYFDLDDFKKVNDQFGETHGGDPVLKTVAELPFRKEEPIARLGGEEFGELIDKEVTEEQLARVIGRYVQTMKEKSTAVLATRRPIKDLTPEERVKEVTISFGLAKYVPGDTADSLMVRSNRAMKHAKAEGKNKAVIAEPLNAEEFGFDIPQEYKFRDLQPVLSSNH